jgi:hypothetical protein
MDALHADAEDISYVARDIYTIRIAPEELHYLGIITTSVATEIGIFAQCEDLGMAYLVDLHVLVKRKMRDFR